VLPIECWSLCSRGRKASGAAASRGGSLGVASGGGRWRWRHHGPAGGIDGMEG
jgi:hypothetical protein